MNNAPFLAFIKDAEGRFLFYNARMAERFGISPEAWLGKNDFEIWPPEIAETMHANDQDVIKSGESIERHEETRDEHGAITTWKVHKFTWTNERGETLLGGIGLDLSEELARERALAEANLKLQQLATTDALTGLANRRVLDERVDYELRLAKRHKTALSLVLLDLDNFKRRNDLYGHGSGDEVLRHPGTSGNVRPAGNRSGRAVWRGRSGHSAAGRGLGRGNDLYRAADGSYSNGSLAG